MKTCTRGRFRIAVASGLLLLGAAGASLAQSEKDSTVYARTVQNFLATLDKAKTVQFEMTVVTRRAAGATKVPEARRYRVSISRPNRLAVVPLTPDTALFGLATDGEELLCYAPTSRQYCVVDAPETMQGIYDLVFSKAVHDSELDETLKPFIVASSRWYDHEPCQVYDGEPLGETEYAGVPCQMFFARRVVAYYESDKRGLYRGEQSVGGWLDRSDSGQEVLDEPASVTIDKWVLDGDISGSDFSVKPPAGYQRVKDPQALPRNPGAGRTVAAGPAADLPANASATEVRRRAWTLFTTGYDDSPITGQLFQRAANLGDPLAVMWVARLQQQGRAGFPADPAAAQTRAQTVVAKVKDLAAAGDPEAQFLWGMACLTALGTPANPTEGRRWLLQAAEKGDTLAMSNVGTLLGTGQAGPRDATKGFQWIEKAAQAGNGLAIASIALSYQWGLGVEPNRGKAIEWHMKALGLGYDRAADMKLLEISQNPHPFTADAIRKMPYVKLFGTAIEDLPKVAVAVGIVPADAVLLPPPPRAQWPAYAFKKNGIAFVPRFGQAWITELYAQGVEGFDRFPGQLPLGLSWDDTYESAVKKLGEPDNVEPTSDGIWLFYDIGDLSLHIRLTRDDPAHIGIVRIMAHWAPQPQAKTPPAASVTGALKK